MPRVRYIEIDGNRYLWRDVHTEARQLALFELTQDCRPQTARTATGRHLEPALFDAGTAG